MTKITKHTKIARKLRQNMTDAERKFWHQVRNRRFQDLKFKRQVSIPPYIVDFICKDYMLIVEIDGGQHCENVDDQKRDTDLQSRGYHVMRFWNNDVLKNIEGVMTAVSEFINTANKRAPSPRGEDIKRSETGKGEEFNTPSSASSTNKSGPSAPSPQGEGLPLLQHNNQNQILIGEIKGAHGVKGLVRVAIYADDTSLFDHIPDYKIILKNKHKGDIWLAAIDGISNKDTADELKGTKLYCDRDALPALSDDEIYFADMVGMAVVDTDGNNLGTIKSVDNFGAGDLLNIKPSKGQDFYLSYDESTVLEIDDVVKVQMPGVI